MGCFGTVGPLDYCQGFCHVKDLPHTLATAGLRFSGERHARHHATPLHKVSRIKKVREEKTQTRDWQGERLETHRPIEEDRWFY